jgi:hypothetical protein
MRKLARTSTLKSSIANSSPTASGSGTPGGVRSGAQTLTQVGGHTHAATGRGQKITAGCGSRRKSGAGPCSITGAGCSMTRKKLGSGFLAHSGRLHGCSGVRARIRSAGPLCRRTHILMMASCGSTLIPTTARVLPATGFSRHRAICLSRVSAGTSRPSHGTARSFARRGQ